MWTPFEVLYGFHELVGHCEVANIFFSLCKFSSLSPCMSKCFSNRLSNVQHFLKLQDLSKKISISHTSWKSLYSCVKKGSKQDTCFSLPVSTRQKKISFDSGSDTLSRIRPWRYRLGVDLMMSPTFRSIAGNRLSRMSKRWAYSRASHICAIMREIKLMNIL